MLACFVRRLKGSSMTPISVNERVAPSDRFARSAWMLTAIGVVVAALYLAKGILVPLTLAVLLSFLLSPVCEWLERHKLGRIPAVVVAATIGFAVLGIAGWTAVVQVTQLVPKLPEYQANLHAKLDSVNAYASAALSKATRTAEDLGQNLSASVPDAEPQGTSALPYSVRVLSSPASPLQVMGGTVGPLLEFLGSAGIVMVLVVFFLVRRDDLRDRFIRLVGNGHVTVTTQMLEDAATRVSRYLSMQFLINVSFGAAVAGGLYFIGVPNAILWGILATTLRFIPYIGPWIAAAMPICLSMAISTSWVAPILTIGLFMVLELFINYVIEPWLYGKNTGVSAVAVLVAAVFWTWLWGVVGLLLATPLTVCLLVLGKHVPQLSFLDTLLGNEPVFEPKKRIYQRLLAGDQEEASELLEDFLVDQPAVDVYDEVLIPALASAETHWHRGDLSEARHDFILQSLKEMIQEQQERQQESQAQEPSDAAKAADPTGDPTAPDTPMPCILCLPARDEADGIAAMMLAQLVGMLGCRAAVVPVGEPVAAVIDLIELCKPDAIFISATPPTATTHARSVVRRLRRQFPEMSLVVGLWNAQGDLDKAQERIGGGKSTRVVATLADAQEQIRLLIRRLVPRTAGEAQLAAQNTAVRKGERLAHEEGRELEVGEPAIK
jgi:predicted PurR-regulated permease PerM